MDSCEELRAVRYIVTLSARPESISVKNILFTFSSIHAFQPRHGLTHVEIFSITSQKIRACNFEQLNLHLSPYSEAPRYILIMSAIPKRRLSEGAEFRAKPVETGDPHDKDEMKLAHRMEKSSTKRVNVGGQVSAVAGLVSDDDFGIASDNKKLKPSPFSHQLSTSSTFGKGDGDGFGSTMMPEASNKILKTEAVHESGVEALLDSKEVVQTSTEFLEFEFDPEKAALILPTNPAECNSYLCAQSRIVVRNTAQKLKQTNGKIPRTLTKDENTLLIVIVSAICNLEHLSKKLVKDMYLKLCLEVLLSPEFAFSAFVRHLASEAYQKYEGQNWGEEAKADLEPENEIITNRNLHGAKKTISKTLSKSKEQHVRKPAATHPIYGANGICRGILIDTSGKAKSYLFDDAYTRRSAKPFGHNGITNGDVWPMLMCALRDGAHGAKMKGIAGTAVNGATSIVISGKRFATNQEDIS